MQLKQVGTTIVEKMPSPAVARKYKGDAGTVIELIETYSEPAPDYDGPGRSTGWSWIIFPGATRRNGNIIAIASVGSLHRHKTQKAAHRRGLKAVKAADKSICCMLSALTTNGKPSDYIDAHLTCAACENQHNYTYVSLGISMSLFVSNTDEVWSWSLHPDPVLAGNISAHIMYVIPGRSHTSKAAAQRKARMVMHAVCLSYRLLLHP